MNPTRTPGLLLALLIASTGLALAQEVDVTQTPNSENAHIKKSYAQEIGAGRGSTLLPDSSLFIIARDPFRSIRRGRELFQRKYTFEQGLGPRLGDGKGNIELQAGHGAGLADSCAACHGRPRGAAASGGEGVDADLRVRPFFHQGGLFSMREFIVGALQAEMGLQAVDPDLIAAAAGGRVVTPSGLVLDGALDRIDPSPVAHPTDDADRDGVFHEVPEAVVDHLEFYLLNYFKPGLHRETPASRRGRRNFDRIGCAACHVSTLTINADRRVADVETVHDATRGVFNRLFSTASARYV